MNTIRHIAAVLLGLLVSLPLSAQNTTFIATFGSAQARVLDTNGDPTGSVSNITRRQIVKISAGGSQVEVTFSNEFGRGPLTIGSATIAPAVINNQGTQQQKASGNTAAQPLPVTFSQRLSTTIPSGATVTSDPVSMTVSPGENLAISFFLPDSVTGYGRGGADSTQFNVPGDHTSNQNFSQLSGLQIDQAYVFLNGVSVGVNSSANPVGSVVALGDSITQGFLSTIQLNHRYTNDLGEDFYNDQTNPVLTIGVANAGITGNHFLDTPIPAGTVANFPLPAGMFRYQNDVINTPGLKAVIVLEGINDIGYAFAKSCHEPSDTPDPNDPAGPFATCQDKINQLILNLENAYKRLKPEAPAGVRIIVGTMTPNRGATDFTDSGQEVRSTVNDWIRSAPANGYIDDYIDFDMALRNPSEPQAMQCQYVSPGALHPNDFGYKVMADTAYPVIRRNFGLAGAGDPPLLTNQPPPPNCPPAN